MASTIDYYYYGASPFSYFGHQAIVDVAEKHGAKLNIKPVNLMGLWAISGAVPPGQRPPVRQRYRFLELQRVADIRGLSINLKPSHFPVDMTLADCCVIAALQQEGDVVQLIGRLFAGVWQDQANMSDEAEIQSRLIECGFDANAILESAKSDAVKAIREQNTNDAIAADAVGAPAFVLNGEVFWGQDRIDHVDHALASGRAAYTPPD